MGCEFMKIIKIKKEYFTPIPLFFCICLIFMFPDAVKSGITKGLEICFYTIIPSLFPFAVLTSYMQRANVFLPLHRLLSPLSRVIFRQPPSALPVIILSLTAGFPIGIKMVEGLLLKGEITEHQAKRLCFFCMNPGPGFVITAVGANLMHSTEAGVIMYASLCLSGLIIGFFTRFYDDKKPLPKNKIYDSYANASIYASVTDGLQTVLTICAWVVLFSAFSESLAQIIKNESAVMIITCLSEVTKGCTLLSGRVGLPIICALMGFGGLCVHCQVLSSLKGCGMKYPIFLLSRLLNGVLSGMITQLLLLIFPVKTEVFANSSGVCAPSFSLSPTSFIIFMLMCIIMIFEVDRKKKICYNESGD